MSQYDRADLIDLIKSTAKMQKIGPKMAIFGPILTQFRSKQLKIQPGSHIRFKVEQRQKKHFKLSFIPNSAKRLLVLIKGVCKKVCVCKKEREIERN